MGKDISRYDSQQASALVEGYAESCVVIDQDLDVLATNNRLIEPGSSLANTNCKLIELAGDEAEVCVNECRISELISSEPARVTDCACGARIFGISAEIPLYLIVFGTADANQELSQYSTFAGISAAAEKMVRMVNLVASGDSPVVVLGESGVGKARIAKAIHDASARRGKPFVPIDCAGLTGEQFDHMLYGSAAALNGEKQGLIDKINGGSLFLSGISKLALVQQFKLLQLLETSQFTRLGGVDRLHAEFRLICATSQDLAGLVDAGLFRRDLYYEINVCPILVPSLRERADDIPGISLSLLHSLFMQKQPPVIHPDTYMALMKYEFPGNIRELKSLLTRACLFAENGMVLPQSLPSAVRDAAPNQNNNTITDKVKKVISLKKLEKIYLSEVFEQFEGQKIDLADQLGISQRTLYRKLRKLKNADSTA